MSDELVARIIALQEANKWATTRATYKTEGGGLRLHPGIADVVDCAGDFLAFLSPTDTEAVSGA